MSDKNYYYEYETSPKKLNPVENPKRKTSNTNKQKNSNKQKGKKNKVKQNRKKKVKLTIYLIIGFAILFAISYRNSLINERFSQVQKLKVSLSETQKENEQLQASIENNLNLNNIEQLAKELLGMQKLDNKQMVYITLPKKDYVEPAAEEVMIEDEKNVFQKVVDLLKDIFM